MPKRNGKRNKWTGKQLELALEAVKKGEMKPHRAALKFGVPSSTLYDHLKGRSQKRYGGRPTVLSTQEEKEIVVSCEVLQQFGFPLTKDMVGIIVRDFLKANNRKNPFKDSMPQYDWWRGFLKRWPRLRERKPEHLPKCRAVGATPEVKNQNKKLILEMRSVTIGY